jgi:hypothetical protein
MDTKYGAKIGSKNVRGSWANMATLKYLFFLLGQRIVHWGMVFCSPNQ